MGAACGEQVGDYEERGVISEEKAQSQGQTGHLPIKRGRGNSTFT